MLLAFAMLATAPVAAHDCTVGSTDETLCAGDWRVGDDKNDNDGSCDEGESWQGWTGVHVRAGALAKAQVAGEDWCTSWSEGKAVYAQADLLMKPWDEGEWGVLVQLADARQNWGDDCRLYLIYWHPGIPHGPGWLYVYWVNLPCAYGDTHPAHPRWGHVLPP